MVNTWHDMNVSTDTLMSMVVWNHSKSRNTRINYETGRRNKREKKETETERAKLAGADPHRFPPLRESVRFFIINIFLIIIIIIIIIIKELFKLKFGKWSGQMFSFSSSRAFYAPSMDQKPKKGTLGCMSPGSPRSLLPRHPL